MQPASGPTRPGERILEIDILRGIALLGILLVNMDGFAWPVEDYRLGWSGTAALGDRLAGWGLRLLAEGKFFPMFSFLFGFGLAMQMARAEARGARFVPLYLRRLLWLFLFGAAHVLFLWFGDILTAYAVLGVALLLFRRCRPKTLVAWAGVCVALSLLIAMGWYSLVAHVSEGEAEAVQAETVARALRIYGQGSYQDIALQRLRDFGLTTLVGTASILVVFAMFLIGLLAGREGLFQDVPARLPIFRRMARWGLAIGLIATLTGVVGYDLAEGAGHGGIERAGMIGDVIGGPALTLFYLAGIVLLCQRPAWRSRLARLAPAGRMPLTNYLMQSVICTTLFYGYGLGLYGKVGVAAGVALAFGIYALQAWWSIWWFRRFEYGPAEWLWRILTYGRARPGHAAP